MAMLDLDQVFTTPPAVTRRDVAAITSAWTGRSVAAVSELASERDRCFIVGFDEGGGDLVVKLANPADDADVVAFRVEVMRVARSALGSLVPGVVEDRDGRSVGSWMDAEGRRCAVTVQMRLAGANLRGRPIDRSTRAAVARMCAELDLALRQLDHPAATRPILWDSARLPELRPLLRHADPELSVPLAEEIERSEDWARTYADFRPQVIHNDLSTSNLLVDPGTGTLRGVLDFGDATRAPMVNDLAVCACYFTAGRRQDLEEIVSLVRDYAEVVPLRAEEVAAIPDLLRARCATTLLIAGWRASLFPHNRRYILRNAGLALVLLETLRAHHGQLASRLEMA